VTCGPGESVEIQCLACGGRGEGCGECGGRGAIEVTGCPVAAVPEDAWEMLAVIDAWDGHKIPPVAGGYHDQAECFLQCLSFVKAEEGRIEARRVKAARGGRGL
jgi:hypothetical protein